MNTNIYDIADRCGVSIATVSRVLNNKSNVKAATRDRILQVIAELDYSPNVFARGMGLNSARMIGRLCTDVTDLYYAKAVSEIERLLKAEGYDLILCCTGNDLVKKRQYLRFLLDKKVDGIILVGSIFKEKRDNSHIILAAAEVPVILINAYIQSPGIFCVLCDDREVSARVSAEMVLSGCRNLLFAYDVNTFSTREKIRGFIDGIRLADKDHQVNYAVASVESPDLLDQQPGISGMILMADVDGILCSGDLLAARFQKYLSGLGRSAPEQVKIVGYDNTVIGGITSPAITSIESRIVDLCSIGVDTLIRYFGSEKLPDKSVLQPYPVYRETFPHNDNRIQGGS
ncbi:MAG: LacI family DNA-binding transcriptional regulator [Saccharofermentanales bacterium]